MFTCEGPILPYVEEVGTSQQKEDDSYICPMFTCEGPILPNVEELGTSKQKEDDGYVQSLPVRVQSSHMLKR